MEHWNYNISQFQNEPYKYSPIHYNAINEYKLLNWIMLNKYH